MTFLPWCRNQDKKLDATVEAHHQQLLKDGFAHIQGAFPAELVSETLKSIKRLLADNDAILGRYRDPDGHYPKLINMHVLHQPLLRLFTESPVALAVQDAFFGSESVVYTSIYFERGSAQPVHRDTPYFSTKPEYQYLGVWVALEDANEVNGCLQVVRGGHLIPEIDRRALALRYYPSLEAVPANSEILWNAYQEQVMHRCLERGLRPERVEVKAGDVVIWHPQLPHGGSEIKDISRSRHSFVMHVTPEGVPVYHQDVFFNPDKKVPIRARWSYAKLRHRKYVKGDFIDIDSKERRPIKDFVS